MKRLKSMAMAMAVVVVPHLQMMLIGLLEVADGLAKLLTLGSWSGDFTIRFLERRVRRGRR